ncbi:MAG TPA: ATP-binding protein [Candidatus Nanopelagicales bacterium]|nr:ATP-binding protein [Candidatus Nanopelagicales bacterium]
MIASISRTWSAMPLRRRLVLGLVAVMAVTLALVGAATFLSLRSWKFAQVDGSLQRGKQQLESDHDRGSYQQALQVWTTGGAQVYIVYSNGLAYPVTNNLPGQTPDQLSERDSAVLAGVPTGSTSDPVSISMSDLGASRAVAVSAQSGNDSVSIVAVTPLSGAAADSDRLLAVTAILMAAGLILAGLTAAWFVRRSLRPLQDVAETASAVAALPLDTGDVAIPARVPDPVPTTEVGQVGLAVNKMLDHVETSLQTRADTEDRLRQFVSDAGHELRTPLAAVRGYAELMRRGVATDPEAARHAAERIEAAGSRMGMLVDDLLLLASLDEGRPIAHERVDLRRLVDEAVAEAASAGPDHEWSVRASGDPVVVVGDPLRLHQAVANLLANALAHTPTGTEVTTYLGTDGRTAVIDVVDDGPGFPADLLPRVTERFARGDASRSRATGGSGLGLAIVKAVVDAHDGSLQVGNRPDGPGAYVRLQFPVAPTPVAVASDDAAFAPPMPTAP